MKRILILTALFCVFSTIFGKSYVPYVDIKAAQNRIDKMKKQNADYEKENTKLLKENEELKKKIDNWNTFIEKKLDPLLIAVKAKGKKLYALFLTIKDEETLKWARKAKKENEALAENLKTKRKNTENQIENAEAQRDKNFRTINDNRLKIRINLDKIETEKASVDKTKKQKSIVETFQKEMDDFQKKAKDILSKASEAHSNDDSAETK